MDKDEATRIATQFREKFGAWLDLRVPGDILQKADAILQSILLPPPKLEWDFDGLGNWTAGQYTIRVLGDGVFWLTIKGITRAPAYHQILAEAKAVAQSHADGAAR